MTSVEHLPVTTWTLEEWDKPSPLPDRGMTIPTLSRREFDYYFMNIDTRIWEMTQAQRETWKNDILDDWDIYRRILYQNKTAVFHRQLRDMDRMGGGVILIPGEMGTGKSILANTFLKIWNVLKRNIDPPHIFWSKNEVRAKIRKTAPNTAHSIDEDMRSTGRGSGNLEVHLQNLFETIRKTGKLVVDVGVNVESSRLARAVGLQIFPIGFNRMYQANRFIVANWKGRPLWLAVTQRFYYPNESVLYEGELGTFAEYDARANEFSRTTTGVFAGTNAEQELEWRTQLVEHWNSEYEGITPSVDVLEFECVQIGIPQESVATIRRICASARLILRRDMKGKGWPGGQEIEVPGVFSDEWDKLRKMIMEYHIKKDTKPEHANGIAQYIVPKTARRSQALVAEDVGTTEGALAKWYERRQTDKIMPPADQGNIGEVFAQSLVSIKGARWDCSTGKPDLLVGDVAVNIKLTFATGNKGEPMNCSPEYNWCDRGGAWLLVFYPRFLLMKLFRIDIHSLDDRHRMTVMRKRGIPVTYETLNEQLEGLKDA